MTSKHLPLIVACFWATLFVPLAAAAEEIRIESSGCEWLDVSKLELIAGIELSSLEKLGKAHRASDLTIAFECENQMVTIRVHDKATDKTVERTVDEPPPPTEERVLALTTAQLVLIFWLEESQAPPNTHVEAPKNAPAPAPRVFQIIDDESPFDIRVKKPPMMPFDLSLWGGVKLPGEKTPLMGRLGIRGGVWAKSGLGLVVVASFDHGSTQRDIGYVIVLDAMIGAGLGWRSAPENLVYFEMQGTLSAGYAHLRGQPEDGSSGQAGGGPTGELTLGFAPNFNLEKWTVALDLQLGYNFGSTEGRVTDGEPISLQGFWGGLGLRTGMRF